MTATKRYGKTVIKRLDDLLLWDRNPRFIKDERYAVLLDSIKENGFQDVLHLAADEKTILGGNHTYRGLLELGYTEAPCIVSEARTGAEMLKLALRYNDRYAEYVKEEVAELAMEFDIPAVELQTFDIELSPNMTNLEEIVRELGPSDDGNIDMDKEPRKPRSVTCPDCGGVFEI